MEKSIQIHCINVPCFEKRGTVEFSDPQSLYDYLMSMPPGACLTVLVAAI